MKSWALLLVSALLGFVAATPQRGIGGCGCREVICPNQGPDHCACINAAADDCARYQRGDCPQPPRCVDNGRPGQNGGQFGGQGQQGGGYNTIYTTMPITYTITSTLPGFYSPRPITSYSTIVSMVTITLSGAPPQNPGWDGLQTIWQTTTVNGIPPWATNPRPTPVNGQSPPYGQVPPYQQNPPYGQVPPYQQIPPAQNNPAPRPTTPRISPTPRPPSTPLNGQNPPPKPNNNQPPWAAQPQPQPQPPAVQPQPPASPQPTPEPTPPRPAPWKPPGNPTQTWTPINNPTIPASQPTNAPAQPPPPAVVPPVVPSPPSAGPPIPKDMGMPPPVAGAPIKCGPGQPVCKDGTYCDPQPLCSIGEDCAGVCLPTFSSKFSTDGYSQPWSVRRDVWQGLLNSGNYSIYSFNG